MVDVKWRQGRCLQYVVGVHCACTAYGYKTALHGNGKVCLVVTINVHEPYALKAWPSMLEGRESEDDSSKATVIASCGLIATLMMINHDRLLENRRCQRRAPKAFRKLSLTWRRAGQVGKGSGSEK